MVESSEQRDFRRMTIDCDVSWKPEGGDTLFRGRAVNLSATGLAMRCDQPVEAGQRLEIKIKPDYTVVPPLYALVEVLRVQPLEDGQYQLACEIREILD